MNNNFTDNNKKKVLFFFCYRFLELRLLITSNLADELQKKFRIIIFTPPEIKKICKSNLSKNIKFFDLKFHSEKHKRKNRGFKDKVLNWLRLILSFTYSSSYKICKSQETTINSYLNSKKNDKPFQKLKTYFLITIVKIISKNKFFRRIIQKIIYKMLDTKRHTDIYKKFKPSFVIIGSFGLDVDANVIKEAKEMNVKSVALTQSWDRIVSKGYPITEPDYVFVWNEHMKLECEEFLDIKKEKVFVTGTAIWDNFFNKTDLIKRNDFLKSLKLKPKKKTIFYPLSAALWHEELMKNLEEIKQAFQKNLIKKEFQMIIRVHPYYYMEDFTKRDELFNKLKEISSDSNIYIDFNNVEKKKDIYILKKKDQIFTLNAYHHSDISISALSSAMVESLFFNNYVINLICGRANIKGHSFDVSKHKLHHLEHLYSYKIIQNVYNHNELIDKINSSLNKKNNKRKVEKFIINEASIHRGNSSAKHLEILLNLSEKNNA